MFVIVSSNDARVYSAPCWTDGCKGQCGDTDSGCKCFCAND